MTDTRLKALASKRAYDKIPPTCPAIDKVFKGASDSIHALIEKRVGIESRGQVEVCLVHLENAVKDQTEALRAALIETFATVINLEKTIEHQSKMLAERNS